ncbi:Snf7 domain-containing protein [Rhizoctonia solani AG-1 IA]|uniref:Snf7 domain-containing protein n=1 Tax=Thanatephorus cucumeris (strain AG1-IA) TaxID=983506 RepID=L8X0H6_THACA|nr:Snf7 domain-containing protein [Rhizoctonia solani AG-1 IA]
MAPLETHELSSLAPVNGNGFYENYDAHVSKISMHERHASDDEASDDGNEGEGANAALLGGHSRSNSLGAPDPPEGASQVIKGIITETAPTLFLTILGMMFTGALLQRVTHWKPMRSVDELFILIPMLNNLKGNLELVLSARLATASHIGVLDRRSSRRALIGGSLSLLQLQALCVSALAAIVSFLLGLALPETAVAGGSTGEKVGVDGNVTMRWHLGKVARELVKQAPHKVPKIKDEGTKSGWREQHCPTTRIVSGRPDPVLAAPQNTTSSLLLIRDTQPAIGHFPFLPFLITMGLALSIPFIFQLCRRLTFSRPLIREGWTPLLVAMAIESGTGIVLDWYVGRYRGFGMLAVVMTSLPGSVGAVFVSRLSTELHQGESNPNKKSSDQGNPKLVSLTLFAVGFPVLISYLLFVWGAGWLPLPFGFVGLFVAIFGITILDPVYGLRVLVELDCVEVPSFSSDGQIHHNSQAPATPVTESRTISCPKPPPTQFDQLRTFTLPKMSGWLSYFTGKKDTRQTARDAIVNTRQHLAVLDKKEENLQRKIEEELKKAKANAVSNKTAELAAVATSLLSGPATAALRRKKTYETELEKLYGQRMTLETQLNAIENANLNAETMAAMKQGAQALRDIHGNLTIDVVDATMDKVREQMELTNEISEAISNPLNMGVDIDEVCPSTH